MKKCLVLALVLAGCSARPPCEEPVLGTPPPDTTITATHREPAYAKEVHLVTFEMGPVVETLEGFMVLRAPDALRVYGMTETGQEAFDVAWVGTAGVGRVERIYRAPFLKDDAVLDSIANAAAKIFLLRPPEGTPYERTERGFTRSVAGVTYFYGGTELHLSWLQAEKFSACFMDWSSENGFYAPRRIHFHSEEGPHPYDLRMKLVRATRLPGPPAESTFSSSISGR
jgi:hypothetical protein